MLPIGDTIPRRHWPLMTWTLIGINLFVFLFQNSLTAGEYGRFLKEFGLIPAHFSAELAAGRIEWDPFFSYMFLHGDWFHLINNLWALWLFGDNVEDRMGFTRFLLFFVTMGVIAGGVHLWNNPASPLPTIGASGAIAGVMGAYFLMYPTSRIVALVPVFFIPFFLKIPALLYLALWFGGQLLSALRQQGGMVSNVAWWAHIGGFIAGLLLHRLFLKPERRRYYC